MSIRTVAILSPGEMGHAVGQLLREHELRVVTCLAGRSARTRSLSEKAGIIDIPDFNEMVAQSDVVMSITTSEAAPQVCQQVADAIQATKASVLFAECNAIAPQTARRLEPLIASAGGRFVDASIIGGPPKGGRSPRFYASGPHAGEFESSLGGREFGLDVRIIGPEIGQASGIKMCYGAMTKGSAALFAQLLLAAERLGLLEPLLENIRRSPMTTYQRHGKLDTRGSNQRPALGQRDAGDRGHLPAPGPDPVSVPRRGRHVPLHGRYTTGGGETGDPGPDANVAGNHPQAGRVFAATSILTFPHQGGSAGSPPPRLS